MPDARLFHVVAADGSRIGVERCGGGPALLAVHGGTADRTRWAPVREALSDRFSLYMPDRRGRGASSDEAEGPYALRREAEDVIAVIESIGEPVRYLGHSYGAVIGLEVLTMSDQVERALLYEPPFDTPGNTVLPPGFIDDFADLLATGKRDEALELFYRDVVGIDPTPLRSLPIWQARLTAVHTLEREARIGLNYTPDDTAFSGLRVPVRLLYGSESPPAFPAAAAAAAAAIPGADLVELPGQGHGMIDADPVGFAERVVEFLGRSR